MSKMTGEQVLMRIFIGEGDRYERTPLYEALMELLRHEGFAGATVLRGVCGFGANKVIHSQKLLDLSAKLPLVVEVVDCPEKINAIMPKIDAMMGSGMITLEKVTVIRYSRTTTQGCETDRCSCLQLATENGAI
jgi:PII-like signaling protein